MATITFFRQARRDGGVRTGIDIDDQTVLSRFEPGESDDDPSLLWYVDVRCTGPRLPREVHAARQWLVRNERPIRAAIEDLAARVPQGSDPSEWPLKLTRGAGTGARVVVACSAVRRLEARRIARILRDLSTQWRQHLDSLDAVHAD